MPSKQSALEWKNEGNVLFGQGNNDAALSAYQRGIEALTRADAAVKHILYSNAAQVLLNLARPEDAITYATNAIDANADFAKSYLRRAKALMICGRYAEATEDCARLVEKAPELADEAASMKTQIATLKASAEKRAREAERSEARAAEEAARRQSRSSASQHGDTTREQQQANVRRAAAQGPDRNRPSLEECVRHAGHNEMTFFPAGPIWFDTARQDFVHDSIYDLVGSGGGVPRNTLTFFLSNYANQISMDWEYREQHGNIKCDHCGKDMRPLLPSPPQCVCGELFCSTRCHKAAKKDHRKICATVRDNNETGTAMTVRFWSAVATGLIPWDPANPTVVPAPPAFVKSVADAGRQIEGFVSDVGVGIFDLPEYKEYCQRFIGAITRSGRNFYEEAQTAVRSGRVQEDYDYFDEVERPFVRDAVSACKDEGDEEFTDAFEAATTKAELEVAIRRIGVLNLAFSLGLAEHFLATLVDQRGKIFQRRFFFVLTLVGNSYRLCDQILRQQPAYRRAVRHFEANIARPLLDRVAALMPENFADSDKPPPGPAPSGSDLEKLIKAVRDGDMATDAARRPRRVDMRNHFYNF